MASAVLGLASTIGGTLAPMEQAKEIFEKQISQDRRFFYAQYAESVAFHQEAYEQAAKNHAQAYAQSVASYWQAEQFHRRDFQLARLQHKRDMEVALEGEIRNGLRDEFAIKNNRFNTLMVCDTVMMGCAFGLLSDGTLPEDVTVSVVWTFMSGLSVSISLLTVSLWCSFIVCRRLNQVTAWAFLDMDQETAQLAQWEEEINAERLQKKFENWFNLHCLAMSAWAERALTGGVIAIFVAASSLLYARLQAEIRNCIASAWMFVGFASATGLFVLFLERRESKLKKRKQGVYKPCKDVSAQRKASALNVATRELMRQTCDELGHEGGAVDSDATSSALLREVSRTAAEKQRAWDAVPSMEEVADQAARAQASAGTEEWLQKAHELLREGLEGEKEWKRDPNDDLFLIGKQAAAARKAQHQAPHAIYEDPAEHDPTMQTAGEDNSNLDSVPRKTSFAIPPTLAAASERDRLMHSQQSLASTQGSKLGLLTGKGSARVDQEGIQRMTLNDMAMIRRVAGEHARSSIITVTNRTDGPLTLRGQSLSKGTWCAGFPAPDTIHPRSEVVFAACSERMLGIPRGGTEGSVVYETVPVDQSDRSSVWSFKLIWSNPLMLTDSRGRYVDHHTTPPEHQWTLAEYFVASDGVDQDENNEVSFIIAAQGDDNAVGDIGVECGLNLAPGEVIHAGLVEKCNAAGIAWERRLFMLTDATLLYVENKRSRTAKRRLQLLNISMVAADELQPQEFKVVMRKDAAGSNADDAGRAFRLRAADGHTAESWVRQISKAVRRARSAIRVHISNALDKVETVACQPEDRVIDLKGAIALRFGVESEVQELRFFHEGDDSNGTSLVPGAMGRLIEDDLQDLRSLGIRDGHQLYLQKKTAAGDATMDLRRTMSSTLRGSVSRSLRASSLTSAATNGPAPEPEGE